LLVYLGYGATGAVIGYVSASAAGAVISTIFLYFSIFKKLPKSPKRGQSLFQPLKTLLKFGVPLALSSGIGLILIQFTSFMMAIYVLDNAVIGNYRIATNFAILLTFVTVPISTVLFPAFSKLDPKNEKDILKTVFSSSIKYSSVFLVPIVLGIVVLSKPLIGTFYGDKWPLAPPFLSLYSISSLVVLLGNMSLWTFFPAMAKTQLLVKVNLLTLAIGIPITILLVPPFGINGLIVSSTVSGLPALFSLLYLAWKQYGVKVDYKSSAKIFLSSGFAALLTYIALSFLNLPNWALLVIGLFLFIGIYLFLAPILGAVDQIDIDSLRNMFAGTGLVSKILEIPLVLMEGVIKHISPR
jgi:stage V sporulation protein B